MAIEILNPLGVIPPAVEKQAVKPKEPWAFFDNRKPNATLLFDTIAEMAIDGLHVPETLRFQKNDSGPAPLETLEEMQNKAGGVLVGTAD